MFQVFLCLFGPFPHIPCPGCGVLQLGGIGRRHILPDADAMCITRDAQSRAPAVVGSVYFSMLQMIFFREPEGYWATWWLEIHSGRRSLPRAGGCPLSRCRWDASANTFMPHVLVMVQLFEDQPLPDSLMENWASCGYTSCFAQSMLL